MKQFQIIALLLLSILNLTSSLYPMDHKSDELQTIAIPNAAEQLTLQELELHTSPVRPVHINTILAPVAKAIQIEPVIYTQPTETRAPLQAVSTRSVAIDMPEDRKVDKKIDIAAQIIIARKQKKLPTLRSYLESLGLYRDVQKIIFAYVPLIDHEWVSVASFDTVAYHRSTCLSADGQNFYLSDGNKTTWNIKDPRAAHLPKLELPESINRIACSPDGKYIVALSYLSNESAIFLNLPQTYIKIGTFDAKNRIGEHSDVVFSASGDFFLYADTERGIFSYDLPTCMERQLVRVKNINSLALSSDNKTVAYAEPYEITVRDLGSLEIRAHFIGRAQEDRKIYKILFSPDGSKIIAGSVGKLIICDIEKKERTTVPTKQTSKISEMIHNNKDLIFAQYNLYIIPNFFPSCASNEPELLDKIPGSASIHRLSKAHNNTFLSATNTGIVKIWKKLPEITSQAYDEIVEIETHFTPQVACRETCRYYWPCWLCCISLVAGTLGLILGLTVK